jgi:putative aminopeptidase FrvX
MDIELIRKLSEAHGVSGFEDEIREIIKAEIKGRVDTVKTDSMGNLIAFRKGSSKNPKKVALIAHMDEIGLLVRRVNGGFIEFTKLGGIDDKIILAQKVTILSEKKIEGIICSKPIFFQKKEDGDKPVKYDDMFIDIGAISKKKKKPESESADENPTIEKGTPISFSSKFTKMQEHTYCGKSLDNRLGVYCLIDIIKNLKENKNDLYFVFSTQEEVGLKGARTAAFAIEPDLAIVLDTCVAGDVPAVSKKDSEVTLGKGVAIELVQAGGRGAILPSHLKNYILDLAKKHNLKYQLDVPEGALTDAAIVQMIKSGILACSIGIPARNLHSPYEIFDSRDVEEVIKLSGLIIENWK